MNTYLVLDIGGSSIKCAVMDEGHGFLWRDKVPVPLDSLDSLLKTVKGLLEEHPQVNGLAMSLPGIIDPEAGVAHSGGALNYLHDTPLAALLEEWTGIPVTIANDAKCAAAAEVGYGALADVQDGAVVILGSGVGGALVKNHQVHVGRHFSSGEFSFVRLDHHDPYTWDNSWDVRCGSAGLLARVQEETGSDEHLDGLQIFECANAGDEAYLRAIDRFARDVAFGILAVHAIFDCEKVAVGGGISAQPLLIDDIQRNFEEIFATLEYPFPKPEVVPCTFRNDANLIGALYQHVETNQTKREI